MKKKVKWMTDKVLLYSPGKSAQCYVAAWMGKESGRGQIHVYVLLSPFAVHLKLSQHCQSVILQCKLKRKERIWNSRMC